MSDLKMKNVELLNYQLLVYHEIAVRQNITMLNEAFNRYPMPIETVEAINPILSDMSTHLQIIRNCIAEIMSEVVTIQNDVITFAEGVQKDLNESMKQIEEAKKINADTRALLETHD